MDANPEVAIRNIQTPCNSPIGGCLPAQPRLQFQKEMIAVFASRKPIGFADTASDFGPL